MAAVLNGKKVFGPGRWFGINNVTNPTPARTIVQQDMSVTFKRSVKTLFGEKQLAADVSSGDLNVTGKVSYGTMNPRLFADLLFGAGSAVGQTLEADNELGTLTTHAYTVANGSSMSSSTPGVDLGVVNSTNGARYVRVASGSEVAGTSYSFASATGVYTFASAETGTVFKFSYLYPAATTGETVAMTNQYQGKVNDFTAVMVFPWTNAANAVEQDVLTLNSCIASQAEIATKMGDYGKPSFDFEAGCDQNDNLGSFAFAEAA